MSHGTRSAERLIVFTDAVVAIAITLLALPLVELGGEADGRLPLGDLLAEHGDQILGFVIGFFVIARLWWAHHRIFEHVRRWSGGLVVLDLVWLFAVVVLALTTSLSFAYDPYRHPEAVALYIGTMVVASGLSSALALLVLRRPDLTDGSDDDALARLVGSVETTAAFALALVIGTLLPVVNYFALLVLAVTGRLDRPIVRRLERRRAAR